MSDFLSRISQYSPKRLALLADELQTRVQELEAARGEPIAIVGIGCRFPGGVRSAEALWQLARDGVDAIREVPPGRWDVDALYDPNPDAPGKMATRWGGFLDDVDRFDPHFFGISPREAQTMDPQQRLVLEVAWEALEHAGISPQRLDGTRAAVYLGLSAGDYYQFIRSGGIANLDAYTASGVAHSIASGRLSYFLGIRGPSVSIDTACSSSLVAIHHAVNSLRRGESALALAGGVNLVLGPEITVALSKARMMAPDGRCKAFDSRADGFVRGEGCGMLVLKRLSDAQADGDRIVAVIRGSASNQDGRSNGLTAPNGPSQEDVLRAALDDAKVEPHEVGYVEAHGTGTSLGDPIEVQALGAVMGANRGSSGPLLIGSVKANIGHLEAAAGVAGLIKLAMAIEHGEVPAQIHVRDLNPHIAWDELAVKVPRSLTPWPSTGSPRRIGGISSFGFSGTNVHIVLEQAPAPAASAESETRERPRHVLTVSARSTAAVADLARSYAQQLREQSVDLADFAFTLNAGRAHFAHRAAFIASSVAEAASVFERIAEGATDGVCVGVSPVRPPRIAFLFTGQGSQYAGMARALYDSQPTFRAAIDECAELLDGQMAKPLRAVLFPSMGEESAIDSTEYTQPALFAIEYALATLWVSWGVRPSMVMGHSVGEVVAATVAGVFSLEDGLKLIAARGRLMGALPRNGGMVSVLATESRVAEAIAPWRADVGIAAINGPESIVISGQQTSLREVTAALEAAGIKCTALNVSHAFHSPLMRPMLAEFGQVLAGIAFSSPSIDLVSNVTGRAIGAQIASASYWSEHVLAAVQFAPAVQAVAKAGCEVMLEIGPHPVLLGMARQCISNDSIAWLPSLRKAKDERTQMLESLAAVYSRGVEVDWAAFDSSWPRRRLTLPGYPFQRERYWINVSAPAPELPREPMIHPLLGREVLQSISTARLFETHLDLARLPYLEDHRIRGSLLVPSPAFMEMMLAAGAQQFGSTPLQLADFTVHQGLALESGVPTTLQLVLEPATDGAAAVRILSRDVAESRWVTHATARVSALGIAGAPTQVAAIQSRLPDSVDVGTYYEWLSSLGLEFGPRFRAAQTIQRRDGEVLARVRANAALESGLSEYLQQPAVLDSCLHVIGAGLPGAGAGLRDAYMLLNVEHIRWYGRAPREFWAHVTTELASGASGEQAETFRAGLTLFDDAGVVLAELSGLHLKRARPDALGPARVPARVRNMIHEILWREAPRAGHSLPRPSRIAERVLPLLDELAAANALDSYATFLPALDRLACAYVVRALRALGFRFVAGERFEGEALRRTVGVLEKHRRLFARMLAMLAEDAILIADGSHWRVLREPDVVDADALCDELLRRHPDCAAELNLTRRCAQSLAPVLKGEADPLPLLFPGGSLAETESLYQHSPPAKTYNSLIAAIFKVCREVAPTGRALRVLEVGAGTGSTTSYVLKELEALGATSFEYTFTDVSPLFLQRAAKKFGNPPNMRFTLFDAGNDPQGQGLESGSFDLVVGANVLHATPDLDVTLHNVRKLMRPGGLLVLLEGATPQRFGDLTVGLLEGWWAYSDTSRRNYALMPRAPWLKLLGEQGFVDAVAVPGESAGPVLSQQAIYVAQAGASAEGASAPVRGKSRRFVIVPDRAAFARSLAESLAAGGDDAHLLAADDAESLGASLRQALEQPAEAVVFLGAFDIATRDSASVDEILASQRSLMSSALAVVQTLAARGGTVPALWLVTRAAQSVGAGESADPGQAALCGFGRVVALEHPELACRRVDLDSTSTTAEQIAQLVGELHAPSREDEIALRSSNRFVRRLVRHRPQTDGAMPAALSPQKSYLVTGGLRGLGLRVAEWLAEQGARHLVLMGRAAPNERARQVIATLEGRGVQVLVVQGDVSLRSDVERALADIARSAPKLGGIIHSAGTLDDGVIASQSWNRFATVMSPKVAGAWLLHTLTQDLDFLVLFSSGASLAGSPGQSNHAAANAFEDALAWYRQARGLPTVSINWGPWAEIGAAVDRRVGVTGLQLIAPADGLAVLGHAMRSANAAGQLAASQLAVFATDWSHLGAQAAAGRLAPLFSDLVAPVTQAQAAAVGEKAARAQEPSLHERLGAAAPNRRRTVVREFVKQKTARVLGLPRPDDLDVNEPLRQLGLDSLMAVELRNVLGEAVSCTLPATVTFDYPSVAALVDFLCTDIIAEQVGDSASPQSPAAAVPAASDSLDDMSEDELAAQLAARLAALGGGRP